MNNSLAKIIRGRRNNIDSIPAGELLRNARDVSTAALLSKMVRPINSNLSPYDRYGDRSVSGPDIGTVNRLTSETINSISDAETVMELLPDLDIGAQILISSILAPKDLLTTELIHNPPDTFPTSISGNILNIIKRALDDDYKIQDKLPKILKDILFLTGSYPVAVIPENSLDHLINSNRINLSKESLEEYLDVNNSVVKSKGILGNGIYHDQEKTFSSFSLESILGVDLQPDSYDPRIVVKGSDIKLNWFNKDKNKNEVISIEGIDEGLFKVVDNLEAFSMSFLRDALASKRIHEKYTPFSAVSLESMEERSDQGYISDRVMEEILYRNNNYEQKHIVKLANSDQCYRSSVGDPLILKLPSESVIPVIVPGSPSDHIGYFVVCDETGNPITKASVIGRHDARMGSMPNNGDTVASRLLDKARESMYGGIGYGSTTYTDPYNHAARLYGELIENDLIQRFKSGMYKRTVKIGLQEQAYRIMFSRALESMGTQLIYVPVEMMSYMALNYDENGVGRSLLDKTKTLNSLAIQLMLANVNAAAKNSIPRTLVQVTIDPDDPAPLNTINKIQSEYYRLLATNSLITPGMVDPTRINDVLSRAGVQFQFSGSQHIPEMSIDIQDTASSIQEPSTELIDQLKAARLNAIGLTPEMVDQTLSPEFATSIIENHLLFSRRTLMIGSEFAVHLTHFIRKFIINTPSIWNEIIEEIASRLDLVGAKLLPEIKDIRSLNDRSKRSLAEALALNFINHYDVSFPKPDLLSLENKKKAFDNYLQSLESAIDSFISSEIFNEVTAGEELSAKMDSLKAVLKATYARKWMVENDYMAELFDLITMDDEENPIVDVYTLTNEHNELLNRSLAKILKKLDNVGKSTDAFIQTQEISDTDDSGFDSSSSSDDDDDDSGDGGGDSDDPFGFADIGDDGGDDPFADLNDGEGKSDNKDDE